MSSSAPGELPTGTAPGYKPGESTMHALTWHGKRDVRVSTVDTPTITDPTDIIIKTTGATVCGSDLHLFHGDIPDIEKGEILGHEGVGVVDQVGAQITRFKVGDRVVASFSVACGSCQNCKDGQFNQCDRTNKSGKLEQIYGQKLGGILGYSHLLGGYAGTQAEYFRIPYGDVNCFHLPDEIPDEKALLLADVSLTAYHSVIDIGFKEGETAAIWGAGPIGQLIAQWLTKVFDAKKVILIDNVAPRLQWAKDRLDIEVINFDHTGKVAEEIMKKVPGGVDVSFDAAGFRYSKSFLHRAMQTLALETDTPETLNEAIRATRKGGRISVIADYAGVCGGFLIGALMMKAITLKGNGQAPVQRYMDKVINEYVIPGKFDPTLILTHRFAFDDVAKAYKAFDQKRTDEAKGIPYLKAFIETTHSKPRAQGTPELGPVPGA
ncbi:probable glutathione-dependent formaldehyde dehydrogenase [Melanopsichium pennsylvanicum]|uniref:Probable glutathione-dependent formaldehyde dehydrogenase n=2 Tax=Melanopsichium pennsylvanicum TaxID=63383 RepID=A0AAJ5C8B9_9BASI|nr:probable glutathione-dependent formaldehyde dehydrogenase [Melanopsichium pennsylvanicum 4]SNX87344.1 probable glutathione-dependent formaldehyde dehydrogenase [Melanopsichium pennsylvanicum]